MKKKRMFAMMMSLALVAIVSVVGTLAYLSEISNEVTNSFTVGRGYIDEGIYVDEFEVDGEGMPTEYRTRIGNLYPGLEPGDTRVKDPTVHFIAGSVESYIFAKVTGVADAAQQHILIAEDDWNVENWLKIADTDGDILAPGASMTGDGIYLYIGTAYGDIDHIVSTPTGMGDGDDINLGHLFTEFKFDSDVDNEAFDAIDFDGVVIKVMGCAVQAAEDMENGYTDAFPYALAKFNN